MNLLRLGNMKKVGKVLTLGEKKTSESALQL